MEATNEVLKLLGQILEILKKLDDSIDKPLFYPYPEIRTSIDLVNQAIDKLASLAIF